MTATVKSGRYVDVVAVIDMFSVIKGPKRVALAALSRWPLYRGHYNWKSEVTVFMWRYVQVTAILRWSLSEFDCMSKNTQMSGRNRTRSHSIILEG